MMPGETILSGAPNPCPDCGTEMSFQVCQSAAGYYIGTWCKCGPCSRESIYYPTYEIAKMHLNEDTWVKRS